MFRWIKEYRADLIAKRPVSQVAFTVVNSVLSKVFFVDFIGLETWILWVHAVESVLRNSSTLPKVTCTLPVFLICNEECNSYMTWILVLQIFFYKRVSNLRLLSMESEQGKLMILMFSAVVLNWLSRDNHLWSLKGQSCLPSPDILIWCVSRRTWEHSCVL